MRRRPITLPTHALGELVAGLVLVCCGFTLDLGVAGTVLTLLAGGLLTGLGLGVAHQVPLAVHQAIDRSVVIVLAVCAVIAAADGGALAAGLLLAAGIAELALLNGTRWTRGPLIG